MSRKRVEGTEWWLKSFLQRNRVIICAVRRELIGDSLFKQRKELVVLRGYYGLQAVSFNCLLIKGFVYIVEGELKKVNIAVEVLFIGCETTESGSVYDRKR